MARALSHLIRGTFPVVIPAGLGNPVNASMMIRTMNRVSIINTIRQRIFLNFFIYQTGKTV
jgi:hypothetical protein